MKRCLAAAADGDVGGGAMSPLPGVAVHGMCGYHAAQAALADLRRGS